ncbi:MAG TPA: glycosyltransferase [Candidatus Mediterraneibacter merdigallinarum]|nr:glycosyltransferase [Candidatus Mediterraneibacter merdigallinarum]
MKEKISIIIPAYNICDYIEKCLDSVCAQTYRNIEIIVVDDGSTDGTADIIDRYADNKDCRVRAIHQKNSGVTSARLKGVKEAGGEFIGFVDGDDYIEPDMYESLYEKAIEYNADISHCGYQMVFPNGRIDYYYNTGSIKVQDNETGVRDLLTGNFVEPGLWNKLYRKTLFLSFFSKVKMDYSIKINEDLLMNYYLFREAKKAVFVDMCPYHYLLRKNSAATSDLNVYKIYDPIKVTKKILLELNSESDVYHIVEERLIRQLINLQAIVDKKQVTLVRECRKEGLKELKSMIHEIVKNPSLSTKIRIMSVLACKAPFLYRYIYLLYSKLTGIDKKYTVE